MSTSAVSGKTVAALVGLSLLMITGVVVGLKLGGPRNDPDPQPVDDPVLDSVVAPADEHRLVDVAAAAGVDFRHHNDYAGKYRYLSIMGGGVALFDYDRDGDLDIFFVNGNRIGQPLDPKIISRLYRNDGRWKFTDVTTAAGVGLPAYGQGCTAADYDDDGDLDLFVTNFGPDFLYRNNGDGTFAEVAAQAGVADDGWGQCACFVDYDRDGRLDLYVQNYLDKSVAEQTAVSVVGGEQVPDHPSPLRMQGALSRLYRNEGAGKFRDVTLEAGLNFPNGKGMGLAWVDFDHDGDVDLFVANDTMENYFFRNNGAGKFEEVGKFVGVAYDGNGEIEASMGVDVADFDHDGDWDLIVPCLSRQVFTLYRNDGPQFTDIATRSGLAQATGRSTGFDGHFFDVNNDGALDLFFTCGGVRRNERATVHSTYSEQYGMPDLLLLNDGASQFQPAPSPGPYFEQALIGRGSAVGDLDNDGDLDLVISNLNDRAVVLRNNYPPAHWLTLNLVDAQGRENPNGVRVQVTVGPKQLRATTHPGVSYLSLSDRRPHFGLGTAQKIDRLEIEWPSGAKQSLEAVAADQFLTVKESR